MKNTNMGNMMLKHHPKECYEQKYQLPALKRVQDGKIFKIITFTSIS